MAILFFSMQNVRSTVGSIILTELIDLNLLSLFEKIIGSVGSRVPARASTMEIMSGKGAIKIISLIVTFSVLLIFLIVRNEFGKRMRAIIFEFSKSGGSLNGPDFFELFVS